MKSTLKRIVYPALNSAATINRKPFRFILMLVTARSGSTLLQHILTTHPDINGYGEAKTRIATTNDLAYLAGRILYYQLRHRVSRNKNAVYMLDKVAHNHLLEPDDAGLLNDPRISTIFLIREPVSSINSYMKAFGDDTQQAASYYQGRLQTLTECVQRMDGSGNAFFLDHRQLIDDTSAVLRSLEQFLGLSEPLTAAYRVHSMTGNPRIGDKSPHIEKGVIDRQVARQPRPDLPPDILERTTTAYESASRALSESCKTIARA